MKYQLIILIAIIVASCQSTTSSLANYYNEEEIESIYELVDFFKDQLCNGDYSQSVLKIKIDGILDSLNAGSNYLVELDNELMNQKLNKSLETLKSTTISNKCYAVDRENDLKEAYFCLKPNSAYMDFLRHIGKEDKGVEKYRTTFEALGTISPTAVGYIIENSKDHNYSEDIVTVIALHFIHINSELEAQTKLEIGKPKLEVK